MGILKKISEIFVPKEIDFYKLMEEQADICVKGAETFKEFVINNTKTEKDYKNRIDILEYKKKIGDIENEGDAKRYEISKKVAQTFITPIDKEDMLKITSAMDEILNYMDTGTKEIILFEIPSTEGMKEISELLYRSVNELKTSIYLFRDRKYNEVLKHALEAKKYENYVETVYRKELKKFFDDKELIKNISYVLKLREVYRHLSNTADKCDAAGNNLVDLATKMM